MIETTTIAAGTTSTANIGPPASNDTLAVMVLGSLVGSIKGGFSGGDVVTLSTSGSVSGTITGTGLGLATGPYDTLDLVAGSSPLGLVHGVTGFQALNVQGGSWSFTDQASFGVVDVSSGASVSLVNLSFVLVDTSSPVGTLQVDGTLTVDSASSLDTYVSGSGKIIDNNPGSFSLAFDAAYRDHLGVASSFSSFSGEIDLNSGTLTLPNGGAGARIVFGSGAETVITPATGLSTVNTNRDLLLSNGPETPTLVNFHAGDQLILQGNISNVAFSNGALTYSYQATGAAAAVTESVAFSGLPAGMGIGPTSSSTSQTTFGLISQATYSPVPSIQAGFATQEANLFRVAIGSAELTTPTRADGSPNPIYAQQQAALSIASQLDAGSLTLPAAQTALYHLVDGTVSVAELSYDFFTGQTVSAAGLNYLVHSTANTSDLDDPYYQQFSTENRYINFAANLGRFGDSSTATFHAAYDSLSLSDATAKAYQQIFGIAPTADKISAILNALVPDGLGGQETRAQYFAYYGTDGANGTGTKSAAIGWLMSQSVSSGTGLYQNAELNLLADIAHGGGGTSVDLFGFYSLPPSLVGTAVGDSSLNAK